MTLACNGATSRPKPLTPQVVSLGGVAISDLLLSAKASFWFDLAVALGIISFDMPSFCAGEPPALPDGSKERYLSYFIDAFGAAKLRQDMGDLVGHYLWYAACECSDGTQLPTPAPQPPPTGVGKDPPKLTIRPGASCGGYGQWVVSGQTFNTSGDLAHDFVPSGAPPVSAQWAQVTFNSVVETGPSPYPETLTWEVLDSAGVVLSQHSTTQTQDLTNAQAIPFIFPIEPGSRSLRARIHTETGAGTSIGVQQFAVVFCTEPPPGADKDCCPPDPLTTQMLAQVLAYLQELLARGTGQTGYTKGPVHGSVTGSASIPISGNVGVLVDILNDPETIRDRPGNPPYEWNLGWMSYMTGDGMIEERRLTRHHQIWITPTFPLGTTFGYYLNPGVSATFTELKPG